MDKLTEQPIKKKIRNFITLNSVTKDEIRQEYNEIFDKLKEYEDKQDVAEQIFEEIDTQLAFFQKHCFSNTTKIILGVITELKKKYIGE